VQPGAPLVALRTLALHTAATLVAAAVLRVLRPRLDGHGFRVPDREATVHRVLGVRTYQRSLRVAGWDRVVTRWRRFDGTRAGLADLDRHTRLSEVTHLGGAVGGILLVARTPAGRRPGPVLLGVAVHLHPVFLQRALRLRIARLRPGPGRSAVAGPGARAAVAGPGARAAVAGPGARAAVAGPSPFAAAAGPGACSAAGD
jgi:hypothetical protein